MRLYAIIAVCLAWASAIFAPLAADAVQSRASAPQVAASHYVLAGTRYLWVTDADGTASLRIDVAPYTEFAWLPTSPIVAYVHDRQVWTVNIATRKRVQRTHLRYWSAFSVAVSSHGRKIAFLCGQRGVPYGREAIFLLGSRTAEWPVALDLDLPIRLPIDDVFPDEMAFSPSGDTLLVSCEGEDGGAGRIERISLHTGRHRGIYGFGVDRQYYSLDFPAYSPNGAWIAAESDSWAVWRPGGRCDIHQSGAGLVVIDRRGRHARRVASVEPNGPLVWSRDCRSVLYGTGSALEAVNVRTGAIHRVFTLQRMTVRLGAKHAAGLAHGRARQKNR